ncbi:alpha/beta fold hydrolase [Winogradskyella immobilis]|uniref:Alpha/beta hydrolase n=1 Tax=Winogradskyella immobilis TaxID=2816852 RepID=A0ABS8EJL5_9FLAO|nr:alpha/beta hydrolase [Winogradskyella immobilis]MCC1483315.1 alpha/beta hydrolase [Winogradskyella immobilis]MCG0015409.1 alpha/beta hydrolase [Winogradskyella immobilis]
MVFYKNISLNYTETGIGKPVILLHGFLENSTMWKDLIPKLKCRTIAIDLLGHGKTDSLGYIHTMEDMADAVLAVLKTLNIKNAHFIGHSMGGYVALALAKSSPTLFSGLCLMNSTFEADDEERKELRTRANKMIQTNFNNMVRVSFANLFAPKSKTIYKTAYEKALVEALKTSRQGYMAAQEGMKIRLDHFDTFKNLKAKKLIIIGRKDPVINSDILIKKVEHTDIEITELSEGHMSHIENKSELSYFLNLFIE